MAVRSSSNGNMLKWAIGIAAVPTLGVAVSWGAMSTQVQYVKDEQTQHEQGVGHPEMRERMSRIEERVENVQEQQKETQDDVKYIRDLLTDEYGKKKKKRRDD